MPIVSPVLDDLRYDRTVEELVRRIPVYAPEWTDHNDSDPGITLIQLFAYLAEQVGYRLNRIPEKNEIALLQLLGVRLQPAHAATTALAFLLADPATLVGYTIPAGARATAKKSTPPSTFETDATLDVVPAQCTVLVTTKNPWLADVLRTESGRETPAVYPTVPNANTEWMTVAWDGKTPKLKDMPTNPVRLFAGPGPQPYLWIGLDYNAALDAGFRNVQVTLTVQLDDDEQPDLTRDVRCDLSVPTADDPTRVDWLAAVDGATGDVRPVAGRVDDTTQQLTRSGTLRFTVPIGIGAPTAWADLRPATPVGTYDACLTLADTLAAKVQGLGAFGTVTASAYRSVLDPSVAAAHAAATAAKPVIGHPLDPALRAKARGWLRLTLAPRAAGAASPKLRLVSFNVAPATNATTVTNEILGRGDGRPGQQYLLANQNVLGGTLDLAVQEDPDPSTPLVNWSAVATLDAAGPFDSVCELDPEAGAVQFGEGGDPARGVGGRGGRIPPLVPQTGDIIARRYRAGGGAAGNVPAGAITALDTPSGGIADVVNPVGAAGGRDAETLGQAKRRARKELSTRSRAVTAADFEWIALQTPDVRVARAAIVALRRPLPRTAAAPVPPAAPRCGPPLPAGPLGLATTRAPGAVTVVVVPDDAGPEPTPTPSLLRAVCRQLDEHRLVTTEVHVVPPQFCRVCNVMVRVQALPGYTRSQLQTLVERTLGAYLHVLTGGDDGAGFPFGGQLHAADLVARVLRTEGVQRVDLVTADFTRTASGATPREGRLVLCPAAAGEIDRLTLSAEENVSVDVTTINVATVS